MFVQLSENIQKSGKNLRDQKSGNKWESIDIC